MVQHTALPLLHVLCIDEGPGRAELLDEITQLLITINPKVLLGHVHVLGLDLTIWRASKEDLVAGPFQLEFELPIAGGGKDYRMTRLPSGLRLHIETLRCLRRGLRLGRLVLLNGEICHVHGWQYFSCPRALAKWMAGTFEPESSKWFVGGHCGDNQLQYQPLLARSSSTRHAL